MSSAGEITWYLEGDVPSDLRRRPPQLASEPRKVRKAHGGFNPKNWLNGAHEIPEVSDGAMGSSPAHLPSRPSAFRGFQDLTFRTASCIGWCPLLAGLFWGYDAPRRGVLGGTCPSPSGWARRRVGMTVASGKCSGWPSGSDHRARLWTLWTIRGRWGIPGTEPSRLRARAVSWKCRPKWTCAST